MINNDINNYLILQLINQSQIGQSKLEQSQLGQQQKQEQ